jgi:hypothetical protein
MEYSINSEMLAMTDQTNIAEYHATKFATTFQQGRIVEYIIGKPGVA